MGKKITYAILLLFVVLDLGYSFVQHKSARLEGDIAEYLVPSATLQQTLESPLGLDVILNDKNYPNPNRFFSHWTFKEYLTHTPLLVQKFTDPIESIYLACAIAKTSIQCLLIILLAVAVSGTTNLLRMNFILAAALVTPLFQTNGYNRYMGIVDLSITHVFFYALPCALLLLYFLPIILKLFHSKYNESGFSSLFLLIPLALVTSLSGILNPAIVLVFTMLVFLWKSREILLQNDEPFLEKTKESIRTVNKSYWIFLLPICLFSIYSLYIGQFNSIHGDHQLSLLEMYLQIPMGVYYQFTQKPGWPILFIVLIMNIIIIWKKRGEENVNKLLNGFKWIGAFALLYILLLPLGGFRDYRPNILRYDTIMPITFGVIFLFGTTTLYILNSIEAKQRRWYIPIILFVGFVFTHADEPKFDKNKCEREALSEIASSSSAIIKLNANCTVMAWDPISTAEKSELNAELLQIWNVTESKKLYYQE